ncbi:PFL_4669 family integrating conjugative element protein [Gilvimarinus chinensis]|uniref:PFL_4669 family integrating conjugative element protein n=1 Tax=Gilvimarinus chinensis TaxID=396005 RepID=UPI000371A32D|nr:TIGR03761 family integrating conjugative element protein [Gilvimarinus chinensis]
MEHETNETILDLEEKAELRAEAKRNLNRSHPDGADSIVKPASVQGRPGRLETGGGKITLETRQAHALFYGRRGDKDKNIYPIVGLVRFAKNVAEIWHASENDDPYADQALLEIETKFEDATAFIRAQMKHIEEMLETELQGIDMPDTHSVDPATMDIQFYSPWAYRSAILLTQFDRVVLSAMTAKKMGLMFEDDWTASIVKCSSLIRSVFEASRLWVNTSVKRDDLAANNKVAQRAAKVYESHKPTMPSLSEDVRKGERRAKLAPRIKTGESADDRQESLSDI